MAAPKSPDQKPYLGTRPTASLAQADERMNSVVNHVIDGIISIDECGTIVTFNPAADCASGCSS